MKRRKQLVLPASPLCAVPAGAACFGINGASIGWLGDGKGMQPGSLRGVLTQPLADIRQREGTQLTTPCKLPPDFWKKGTP